MERRTDQSVELCMISTPDGEIDVDGRSGPLGGPADQARIRDLRSVASVVLVGAGTARAEQYRPPSRSDLRVAMVSRSCNLDFTTPLFTSGAGLVATTVDAPSVPVDSIRAGTGTVDLAGIIQQLPAGIIQVEGGPMLNAALFEADLIDAINVTMSPKLGGRRGPSISYAPHAMRMFTMVNVETKDDFVFVRYERKK